MSTPQTKKNILHVGLDGPLDSSAAVTSGMTKEYIHSQLNASVQQAHDTGRYNVQLTFTMPERFEETLRELKRELETGKWDALVIGGGLKMTPQLTPQFERVVNTAREAAPKAMLLFQAAPGDILATLQRAFE